MSRTTLLRANLGPYCGLWERSLICTISSLTIFCFPWLYSFLCFPCTSGRYHGKATFDCFTNYKGVHELPAGMEFANMTRYPPFVGCKWKERFYELALYNSGQLAGWMPKHKPRSKGLGLEARRYCRVKKLSKVLKKFLPNFSKSS